jgi:hypothetical protein
VNWAVRFTIDDQRDGRLYAYEMIDDLSNLNRLVSDKRAVEVYAIRAFPSTVAETIFRRLTVDEPRRDQS